MDEAYIEVSRKKVRELGGVKDAVRQGWFTTWDERRIKGAFNFGNGTIADFNRFMKQNKPYALFIKKPNFDIKEKAHR